MKTIIKTISAALLLLALFTACDDPADPQSSDANLSSIAFSNPTEINSTFASTNTNCYISTAVDATNVDITPTASDAAATLRIKAAHGDLTNWTTIASGSTTSFELVFDGSTRRPAYGNVIDIEVSAEDGTTKTYTLTFEEN